MTRWFEEIVTGQPVELGSHSFTEDEIIAFAKLYDPQYFHTDPEAAKHSQFGGVVASGWHTMSAGQRLMVDRLTLEEDIVRDEGSTPGVSGPSPGLNYMRFKTPVRPGDTITYWLTVTGKRVSNSIPGWGLLFNRVEGRNQRDEQVYEAELVGFSKLRDYRMPLRLKLLMALAQVPGLGKLVRK